MDALPLGSAEAAIVSIAGAAFAVTGVGVLLGSRGEAARTGAALAVFLVGAGLMSLPWIPRGGAPAGEPAAASDPIDVAPEGITVSADGLRTVAAPAAPGPPPPLPGRPATRITIEASEAEPNDNLAVANVAKLGTTISGTLDAGDLDYFAVDVPEGRRDELVVNLVGLEGDAELSLFDDAGQGLGTARTRFSVSARTINLVRKIDRPRYHVLVLAVAGENAGYQLTIAERRR
jgi:hypothetical protein